MSVMKGPGATVFTRMFMPAHSSAMTFVNIRLLIHLFGSHEIKALFRPL
jgi:hypothetical protein